MSYNTTLSIGFAVTFLVIVLAGFALAFSVKAAAILLGVAFCMNLTLFIISFFRSILNIDDSKDWDLDDSQEIHP